MEKEKLSEYVNLNDLSLIATLRYFAITEESVDRSNLGRVVFVFCVIEEVNKIIKQYYAGELLVEPSAFSLHLKAVKGRIYSQGV